MHLFPTYSQFEHLCTLITEISDTFGLSIDFEGPTEIRDGKAFARCKKIYSADLVTVPAANDRGLFGELFGERAFFSDGGSLVNPFDTSKIDMTAEEIKTLVAETLKTELSNALPSLMKPHVDGLNSATQKFDAATGEIADLKAKIEAIKPDQSGADALKIAEGVQAQFSEMSTKLGRRLGLEFAARAGADPVDGNPAQGDQRKGFEIPASEQNAAAVADILGIKS